MRIWKLACLAVLCCFMLVGCTPTQSGDTAKAEKLLGFKAQYDIDKMCEDSYRFTRKLKM